MNIFSYIKSVFSKKKEEAVITDDVKRIIGGNKGTLRELCENLMKESIERISIAHEEGKNIAFYEITTLLKRFNSIILLTKIYIPYKDVQNYVQKAVRAAGGIFEWRDLYSKRKYAEAYNKYDFRKGIAYIIDYSVLSPEEIRAILKQMLDKHAKCWPENKEIKMCLFHHICFKYERFLGVSIPESEGLYFVYLPGLKYIGNEGW